MSFERFQLAEVTPAASIKPATAPRLETRRVVPFAGVRAAVQWDTQHVIDRAFGHLEKLERAIRQIEQFVRRPSVLEQLLIAACAFAHTRRTAASISTIGMHGVRVSTLPPSPYSRSTQPSSSSRSRGTVPRISSPATGPLMTPPSPSPTRKPARQQGQTREPGPPSQSVQECRQGWFSTSATAREPAPA